MDQWHSGPVDEVGVGGGIEHHGVGKGAFLDGRDTPPKSAEPSIAALQKKIDAIGTGRIASISGRYYAMDRDKRWERVQPAYDVITQGKSEFWAASASDAYTLAELDQMLREAGFGPSEAHSLRPAHQQLITACALP